MSETLDLELRQTNSRWDVTALDTSSISMGTKQTQREHPFSLKTSSVFTSKMAVSSISIQTTVPVLQQLFGTASWWHR